jgi:hypothetical protein
VGGFCTRGHRVWGTAFMIRFLIALLREGSAAVCHWVIPVVAAEGEEPAQEVFETG